MHSVKLRDFTVFVTGIPEDLKKKDTELKIVLSEHFEELVACINMWTTTSPDQDEHAIVDISLVKGSH